MKKFAALALGTVLSLSIPPAAHAQSLSFGSLGGQAEAEAPIAPWQPDPNRPIKDWTQGVAYDVMVWDGSYAGRNSPLCDIRVTIHENSAFNVPVGKFTIVDKATGAEVGNPSWGHTSQQLTIVQYPGPDYEAVNPSWYGTTRTLSLLMVREDGVRTSLGDIRLSVPKSCPVGEAEREWLASGWVVPANPPVPVPVTPWPLNPTEPTGTWTEGVAYDISLNTDYLYKQCSFALNVYKDSTADLPAGTLAVRDKATGRELIETNWNSSTHFLQLFQYHRTEGNGDWVGSQRSFTVFIVGDNGLRAELGDVALEIPKICPVPLGQGRTVATGLLQP